MDFDTKNQNRIQIPCSLYFSAFDFGLAYIRCAQYLDIRLTNFTSVDNYDNFNEFWLHFKNVGWASVKVPRRHAPIAEGWSGPQLDVPLLQHYTVTCHPLPNV